MDRLMHDTAWAGMYQILEVLPPAIAVEMGEEGIAIEIYRRLKAMLQAYEVQVGKREKRIHPN